MADGLTFVRTCDLCTHLFELKGRETRCPACVDALRGSLLLRDWFAGLALGGYVSGSEGIPDGSEARIAAKMYRLADAMIAAREEPAG